VGPVDGCTNPALGHIAAFGDTTCAGHADRTGMAAHAGATECLSLASAASQRHGCRCARRGAGAPKPPVSPFRNTGYHEARRFHGAAACA